MQTAPSFYKVDFELAALLMLAGFLVAVRLRNRLPSRANLYFRRLLEMVGVVTLLDITTGLANNRPGFLPRWAAYAHTTLYFALAALLCLVMWQYFTTCLGQTVWIRSKRRAAMLVPLAVFLLVLLVNPFTHWIFYYDAQMVYCYGPLHSLSYLVTLSYVLGSALHVLHYRRLLNRSWLVTTVFYLLCVAVCGLLQALVFKGTLLIYFGAIFGLILYYITVQNPDSYLDKATGALNHDALSCVVQDCLDEGKGFGCIVVQLPLAEDLEEAYGAANAHELPLRVSEWLMELVGPSHVFRTAADRFILFDPDHTLPPDAVGCTVARFEQSWTLGEAEEPLRVRARVLELSCPEDGGSLGALERAAHALQRRAEEQNNDSRLLRSDAAFREALRRESVVQRLLEDALAHNALEIFLQPLFDPALRRVTSAEVLVRLRDEEGRIVPPDTFIPLAERTGLIAQLGAQVFRKACAFAVRERVFERGLGTLQINLSPSQCVRPGLAEEMNAIAAEYGVPMRRMQFELTETIAMGEDENITLNLNALHAAGACFSLDDYGTGYSNLNRLGSYRIDAIKLDKTLVWSYCDGNTANLEFLVPMFRADGKIVVAEGVETAQQAEMLISLRCDALQGYYYAKPMPEKEFARYLASVSG